MTFVIKSIKSWSLKAQTATVQFLIVSVGPETSGLEASGDSRDNVH